MEKASDSDQRNRILEEFARSFNDTHLWVSLDNANCNLSRNFSSKFVVKEISSEVIEISLPIFDLNTNQKKDFDLILRQLPKIREKKAIIFDLRGNQGGNSDYGNQIINSLFGDDYAQHQRGTTNSGVYVDWRASPDNLEHLRHLHKRYQSEWLVKIIDGMKQSLQKHKPFYYEKEISQKSRSKIKLSNPVKAKLIVIIDSVNVSAALDFIDELKMMKHSVVLIGKTTRADRLYMEVRTVNLPSGSGTFSFPIKVYRNRSRGDNVPYIPDYECEIEDTEKLEQSIVSILKNKI